MRVFDAHAHVYPDAIAQNASNGIAQFYDMPTRNDGRLTTLFEKGGAAGIARYMICSVATVPRQVQSINNFIAECIAEYPRELVGFAAMHPDLCDLESELDRAMSLGLRGVKIHPDFQRVDIDDARFYRLYECIQGRIPVLMHTGDMRYDFSHPRRVRRVLEDFPRLTVICPHLGGWMRWDEAIDNLAGRNLYVDTCSSLYELSPGRAAEIIRRFGVEHVLFGTDYPMWNPDEELIRIDNLPLTQSDKARILWDNAAELFGA